MSKQGKGTSKRSRYNSIIYIYMIPIILLVGIVICSALTIFYTTTTINNKGKVISTDWARKFTVQFSDYIQYDGDNVEVSAEGYQLLEDNHLWLQVIDENGDEILSYSKKDDTATHYSPKELLSLYKDGTKDDSVMVGELEDTGMDYIIGFPLKISKIMMYVDTNRYDSGKILIVGTVLITFIVVILCGVLYSIIISRNLERIRRSLNEVSLRSYLPARRKWFLGEIYEGINDLYQDIQTADEMRQQNEKARDQWIANITHDLKTPLAPIKGYAELLSDPDTDVKPEKVHKYGSIILKNSVYTEQLINDLKLTYQLKSGMLPMKAEPHNFNHFVKEIIIDILNHPEFEDRDIEYHNCDEAIILNFDPHLMKRAINNLIINAIVHNEKNTKILISLRQDTHIELQIADNGIGMTREEVESLFNRYYRGTNTKVRVEGTGLGMAIVKQIIELHHGFIHVVSQKDQGTTITIKFPSFSDQDQT